MKIAIIDSDEFYRNYLLMILPLLDGVSEVREFSCVVDDLEALKAFGPGIVVFDPCEGNQVNLSILSRLLEHVPAAALVAFLHAQNEMHGETLYRLGVSNVLSKSSGTEYLRYILRQLLAQTGASQSPEGMHKGAKDGIKLVHKGLRPLRAPSQKIEDTHDAAKSKRSSFGLMSTQTLEPSGEESQELREMRIRLLRKTVQENKDSTCPKERSGSFTSIWNAKKSEMEQEGRGRRQRGTKVTKSP